MKRNLVGRSQLLTLCLLFLTANASAQTNQTAQPKSEAPTKTPLEQIKNTVVFLEGTYKVPNPSNPQGPPVDGQLSGTGFLLYVPVPRLGEDRGIEFLVTNRHMIREPDPQGNEGKGPYFRSMTMRINTRQPAPDGSMMKRTPVPVVTDDGSLTWVVDDDETVDLAITPLGMSHEMFDFNTIPTKLFATKDVLKSEGVNENDEILFSGLFAWSPGSKKNVPIVRHGRLARVLDEPIPLDRSHPEITSDVHLAEVMSFGGNSGSPVFLRIGGVREGTTATFGGYRYFLLGVMQGFFPEGTPVTVNVAQLHGVGAQNSGLAAVVPCDKILKLLDTPRIKAFEDRSVAIELTAQKKNPDEAERFFKESIQLLEANAPHHLDLTASLYAYAAFLAQAGRKKESDQILLKVRSVSTESTQDLNNPKK
jgi:hypothetical protein